MSIRSGGTVAVATRGHGARRTAVALAVAAAAVATGAASLVAAQETTANGRYPVTREQHRIAEQVASAGVPLSALAPSAPDRYTVKSGDTLWGISSMYLTSPWRWPELWGMNRQQVHNPHLIYPGQVLELIKGDGRARLQLANGAYPGGPGDTVRLSPEVRDAGSGTGIAISSIPNNLIEPFLSRPLIVAAKDLDAYPRIVATPENRVYLGRGDIAYARGLTDDAVANYHVFRPATALYDPDDTDRKTPIAYEAHYLGTAHVAKRGEVATIRVMDSKEEFGVGDRMVPITREPLVRYVPHTPDRSVEGRILSVYSGEETAGSDAIVAVNRGTRDGLEVGHVLALLRTGATVRDQTVERKEYIKLPDERIGEMFVFRVFDTISYALILRTTDAVKVGDRFTSPDNPAASINASLPEGGTAAAAETSNH
ncbi:MAG TPA: LysM domain-containing protein [Burkholderiaceae bacterium]|nr:LysM domain-containing protein [Burkholderiaceae bacterium]